MRPTPCGQRLQGRPHIPPPTFPLLLARTPPPSRLPRDTPPQNAPRPRATPAGIRGTARSPAAAGGWRRRRCGGRPQRWRPRPRPPPPPRSRRRRRHSHRHRRRPPARGHRCAAARSHQGEKWRTGCRGRRRGRRRRRGCRRGTPARPPQRGGRAAPPPPAEHPRQPWPPVRPPAHPPGQHTPFTPAAPSAAAAARAAAAAGPAEDVAALGHRRGCPRLGQHPPRSGRGRGLGQGAGDPRKPVAPPDGPCGPHRAGLEEGDGRGAGLEEAGARRRRADGGRRRGRPPRSGGWGGGAAAGVGINSGGGRPPPIHQAEEAGWGVFRVEAAEVEEFPSKIALPVGTYPTGLGPLSFLATLSRGGHDRVRGGSRR